MNKPMRERWLPAEWEKVDAAAIQALARGDADARLQQHALKVIVEKLAGTYEHTFVPGQGDTSTYLEGRRSVGLQIVKLVKVDLALVPDTQPQSPPPARKGRTLKD
jgi:hypothetical protein